MVSVMVPFYAMGGAVDPPVILFFALIADALLGDPPMLWRFLPHPVVLIGRLTGWLERKLNRDRRTPRDRLLRGSLLAAVMILGSVALGIVVTELRRRYHWGWIVELFLVWTLLAQRSLFAHVGAVARALEKDGLEGGRRSVAKIVGRDVESLDEHGIARAAIESCAENFADAVVAPVFWYLLFGCPGLFACKTINTMDSMIGYRNERFLYFGRVAARFDDAMNLIPARLAALLLVIAAIFTPRGRPVAAWRTMLSDHSHHASPNSGWPEAAMAGALDLALAGPRRYHGEIVQGKWIGQGRARATKADIKAGLYIYAVACLLLWAGVIGLIAVEG